MLIHKHGVSWFREKCQIYLNNEQKIHLTNVEHFLKDCSEFHRHIIVSNQALAKDDDKMALLRQVLSDSMNSAVNLDDLKRNFDSIHTDYRAIEQALAQIERTISAQVTSAGANREAVLQNVRGQLGSIVEKSIMPMLNNIERDSFELARKLRPHGAVRDALESFQERMRRGIGITNDLRKNIESWM